MARRTWSSGDLEQGLTPSKFANRTLERLAPAGKGIIEFHDTRKVTVNALDSILVNLKANGFKLVNSARGKLAPKEEVWPTPVRRPVRLSQPVSGAFIEEAKQRVRMAEAGGRGSERGGSVRKPAREERRGAFQESIEPLERREHRAR